MVRSLKHLSDKVMLTAKNFHVLSSESFVCCAANHCISVLDLCFFGLEQTKQGLLQPLL